MWKRSEEFKISSLFQRGWQIEVNKDVYCGWSTAGCFISTSVAWFNYLSEQNEPLFLIYDTKG